MVSVWHPLGNLYIWLNISSYYGWIPLALGLIRRDGCLSTLCDNCGLACQHNLLKAFHGSGCVHAVDGVVWLRHPVVNLYVWLTISSCYGSIPLALGLIVRDGGWSTVCHSWGFACQQRDIKTFPDPGYLHSKDRAVWLWHPLEWLYVWLDISSCYGSIPLALGLRGRDGGSSTLCVSCGFASQERVLNTFPGSGYLHSEGGVVWLWHRLVYLYMWLTISSCSGSIFFSFVLIGGDGGLSTLCHSCGFSCQKRLLKTFLALAFSRLTMA